MIKPKPILRADGTHRAFFGRKAGKTLHPHQRDLFDNFLPTLKIELLENGSIDAQSFFATASDQLIIEIGYGGGEHLARIAAQNPDTNYIGCEVFNGAIGKMLEKIETENLTNIRLFTDDAYKLLAALPDDALDQAYLLYPDPWPKSKHHKRRFVSFTTLDELARVLKPGATFRFATDIEDYANWTMAHILRHPQFYWPQCDAGSWHQSYEGWQATRYEQKARKEGRMQSFYFTFVRR